MPVCPKCGFSGQNNDQCERCGIIYSRMHTMLDARPASGAQPILPGNAPPVSIRVKNQVTTVEVPKVAIPAANLPKVLIPKATAKPAVRPQPLAQPLSRAPGMSRAPFPRELTPAPRGTPAPREVTMVPLVPRNEPNSPVPWVIGTVAVCGAVWGLYTWHNSRARVDRAAHESSATEDADYFDLAVGSLVTDSRTQLREVTDPDLARKRSEDLATRQRLLHDQLASAPMSEDHRTALDAALGDVAQFLQNPVSDAIGAADRRKNPTAAPAAPEGSAPTPPGQVGKPSDGKSPVVVVTTGGSKTPVEVAEAKAPPAKPGAPGASATGPIRVDLTLLTHASSRLSNLPPP